DADGERAGRAGHVHRIADPVAAAGEVVVGGRRSVHRHILRRGPLVETPRQQPVVLQVRDGGEQTGGDRACGVAQNRLVHLDLVAGGDLVVVRLETGGVGVVVVAGDAAVRRDSAGFEHNRPAAIAD